MRVEVRDDRGEIVLSYVTSNSRHFGEVRNLGPGSDDKPEVVEALRDTLRTLGVGQTREL